jgi:hypothetical protein
MGQSGTRQLAGKLQGGLQMAWASAVRSMNSAIFDVADNQVGLQLDVVRLTTGEVLGDFEAGGNWREGGGVVAAQDVGYLS